MKTMKKLMGAAALVLITVTAALVALPLTATAADQYGIDNTVAPSGYAHSDWTTNGSSLPFRIGGSSTTNVPVTMAPIRPIPKDGFGAYLRTGGTNAADTTNLLVTLEGVILVGGVTQVVDNAVLTISTPTTATALPTGYDYLTNFPSLLSGSAGVLARCDGVRVRSIQNTNLGSIWLTNAFQIR